MPSPALTPLPPPGAADSVAAHQRVDARNNMFVTAALYCERGALPVRIRNMSRGGALIESAILPAPDAEIRLTRGGLSATGRIAWTRDHRAGIRFDTEVVVGDWLPGGLRAAGQQRVDEMIHACRANEGQNPDRQITAIASQPEAARQLLDLRRTLNETAEELANDCAVTARHPDALQAIDMVAQALEKLAVSLLDRGR